MKFEHFALNVEDARAVARWYVEHCEMVILRAAAEPPWGHFLGDREGRVVVELYSNPSAPFFDGRGGHPLTFHFAHAVSDAGAAKERLVAAGASVVEDGSNRGGMRIVMLRDPWGLPLQLCQRATPLG